jgi:hypothetical protein
MPAEQQNINHRKGDKRTLLFGPVVDDRDDYVSLAGATAKWSLAKSHASVAGDILLTKVASITSEDWYGQLRWTVRVDLLKDDTINLPASVAPNRFWHSCEYIDGDGQPVTISEGWFELRPSILNT